LIEICLTKKRYYLGNNLMSTYYEILGINPTASQAEIEAAVDREYNKQRRLVIHHDPDTADKAERVLRQLETVRATLTDPFKRTAYDVQIGIGGTAGGLADPTAAGLNLSVLRKGRANVPPKPRQAADERLDAWVCQICHTPNPIGTKFCTKCGRPVGQNCLACGKVIAVTAHFCPHCGANIEAIRLQREAEEAARLARQREETRRRAEEQARAEAKEKQAQRRSMIGCGVLLIILAFSCWAGYGWFTYKWGVGHITMRPGEERQVGEYRVYGYLFESAKVACDGGGFPFGFMVESPQSDRWWGYYYSITGSTQVAGEKLYSDYRTFDKSAASTIKNEWTNFYIGHWGKHTNDTGINGFAFCDFQVGGHTGVEVLLPAERTLVSWQVR
jgi:hypothetical protein